MTNKKENVLHFDSDFTLSEINTFLNLKKDTLYFTKTLNEKSEFHIVKHTESDFKLTIFLSQLLKYYEKNTELKKHLENVKLKGNNNFVIVENADHILIEKLKNDLNILLIK